MKYQKLRDICEITMGQSPESSNYNEEAEGLPFFQGNADFGEIYPSVRVWCTSPKKTAQKNDILISVRAPIGALNYANCECCIGRGLAAIKVKAPEDRGFIFHLLKAMNKDLNNKGTGSTFKAIGKKILEEVNVPIISSKEKTLFVAKTEAVEKIIRQRKHALSLLDDLIKARFMEMFGDPVANPKGWEMVRFDSLCENLDSLRVPISNSDRKTGNYPYYGASGIVDYIDDYIFDDDILLISEDGANLIMRSSPIAFSVSGKVWVNNHAHVVRFKELATQKYIEIAFSLRDISEYVTGSAQPKLNQAKLNAMLFCNPPLQLRKQFLSFVFQIDKSRAAIQKALDQTQLLFDSLMQQYFG